MLAFVMMTDVGKDDEARGLILPPDGLLRNPRQCPRPLACKKEGARYKLRPSVTFHDSINLMQQALSADLACHQQG